MSNKMESEDLVMTHVFYDSYTKTTFVITLRGPFLRQAREAPRLIAEAHNEGKSEHEQMPECRLQGLCHFEVGKALEIKQLIRMSTDVKDTAFNVSTIGPA